MRRCGLGAEGNCRLKHAGISVLLSHDGSRVRRSIMGGSDCDGRGQVAGGCLYRSIDDISISDCVVDSLSDLDNTNTTFRRCCRNKTKERKKGNKERKLHNE